MTRKASDMLNDATYQHIANWLKDQTGVHLADGKKPLVHQRLWRRLVERKVNTYEAYLRLITSPHEAQEHQLAIDLLTTHETFFFREPRHFDWLKSTLSQLPIADTIDVWSAAASTGEELWSLAMVLADIRGLRGKWTLLGSDISQRVIEVAKAGLYPLERAKGIPREYLEKYCFKGIRSQEGKMLVDPNLRAQAKLVVLNLDRDFSAIGPFHLVFLRNVLIYFDHATKSRVLQRIVSRINKGGWLVVSHAESLHGFNLPFSLIAPGVYEKRP